MDACSLCTEAVEQPETSSILRDSVRTLVERAAATNRRRGSEKYKREEQRVDSTQRKDKNNRRERGK